MKSYIRSVLVFGMFAIQADLENIKLKSKINWRKNKHYLSCKKVEVLSACWR